MKKTVVRGIAGAMLAGAAVLAAATPALAAEPNGGVTVVDNPDNGNVDNIYTFAPFGVPVLGFVRSLNGAPAKILPSFGS